MSLETFWRRGAAPAALGSLGSLLSQAAMALFLLGLFEPAAVGLYSVVAQVSFGWATLALAQSPLSLLANQHLSALHAGRQAWRQSAQRWLWLTPLALLPAANRRTPVVVIVPALTVVVIILLQKMWINIELRV